MPKICKNRISVAIATYNGASFLKEQLVSICEQTIKPFEIVISDDNSSDNTIEIINELANNYPDVKFKIIKNIQNIGFAKNFLKAILNTEGDIIFLSDQDDVWMPNKIERFIYAFDIYNCNFAFCDNRYIDESGSTIEREFVFNSSLMFNFKKKVIGQEYISYTYYDIVKNLNLPGMVFAFNKEVLDDLKYIYNKTGLISELHFHDVLISYIAIRKKPAVFINQILNNYRIHEENAIGMNSFVTERGFDRLKWIENLYDNQCFISDVEKEIHIKDSYNDEYVKILNKFISTTKIRLDNLYKFSIFKYFKLFLKLRFVNSIKSLIGDLFYVRK